MMSIALKTTQLENLRSLLESGERIILEGARLGFGQWWCASYACFLGWHGTYTKKPWWEFGSASFGFSDDQWAAMFGYDSETYFPGPAANKSLQERLVLLRAIIAERELELEQLTLKAA